MKKTFGISLLLVLVCLLTAWVNPNFLTPMNVENVANWTALYGILSIGVALVIITGGIDLSIGSVVGLTGTLLPWLLVKQQWSIPSAIAATLLLSAAIGLWHGVLITKMRLQPFVVTLCGLLIYRGIARWFTHDERQGFGNDYDGLRSLATGRLDFIGDYRLPTPMLIMVALAILAAVFLNMTVWGRHLLALGRNEEAARYSGIRTERLTIMAYVICSLLAGIGGILFALDVNSIQPAGHGSFYELYAIAAAVLGGCSLRGGEGSILGVVIGAALMRVLYNSINVLGLPTQVEFIIIGAAILLAVMADEAMRRFQVRKRLA